MSKTKFTKINPATILNLTYGTPAPPKPRPPPRQRPPHQTPSPRPPPAKPLAEWEYAYCPNCLRKFEMLPGCILRKLAFEDTEESEERGFGFGTFKLDPNNECFQCDYSNRVSGWCCIVDSFDEEDSEFRKMELRKYYSKLEKGEDVQLELKMVWSPIPGEVEQRAANYENRKKMVAHRRRDQELRRRIG